MTESVVLLRCEAQAGGAIVYQPLRAASERGFGEWEVHPQKLPQFTAGSVELRHNGDWLAHHPNGYLAFKPRTGGREAAERFCALNNQDKPTRVVDLAESESVSRHTHESVSAELAAKSAQAAAE